MSSQLQHRDRRRTWLVLGFVLLLVQPVLLGCSDDEPPTGPQRSSGSWRDLGLSADFVEVDALATWNGLLIAGGHFHQFQGHLESNLLTWDGATWKRLEPPGAGVNALAVYDGHLIVGSGFSQANGDTLPTIAAWDGTQWTSFDSELNHRSVTALTLYQGDLIAGVLLESNGGNYVSSVLRWNGTSWQSLGGTLNGFISALTVFQGLLVVGGDFDTADGVSAKSIAAWNGTTWTPVGGGIAGGTNSTGSVLALTADGTTLVAGGEFLSAGGVPTVNVARWNGAMWDSLAGLEHPSSYVYVRVLAMYGETLVAGGVFFVDPVRRWSGSEWVPMSTLNGPVRSLTIYNGSLIAGGYFPPSGLQRANGIARWIPPPPDALSAP
jgi:hypothetical protein